MTTRGNGNGINWIRAHADYQHDWCLIWPFTTVVGYGQFGYLGKSRYAHRFMCELVNGPAPSPTHEAAHSCGRGDEGCVNPRHLSWKTPGENRLDCRKHGTAIRSRYGSRGFLTPEQAAEIRALQGQKTQREIAVMYHISESNVSNVWRGVTFTRAPRVAYFTAEEDQTIRDGVARGLDFTQLTALLPGRTVAGVSGRTYRLGLKSGRPPDPKKIKPSHDGHSHD